MAKSKQQTSQTFSDSATPTNASHYHKMLALFGSLTILFLGAAALTLWADSAPLVAEARALHRRPSALREIPEFINLTITETGMASITTEDLRPFNWQLSTFSHETINLTRQGEQVPYFIDDDGQTMFFLAEAITSTLLAPAVYQLSLGTGLAMPERDVAASGRGSNRGTFYHVWEENRTFLPEAGGVDPWLGRLLLAPETWDFSLDGIQPSGGRGRLTISVWSSTASPSNPDHHLQVGLNGVQLEDWVWDGIQHTTTTVDLPRGLLQPNGRNTLSLTSPGNISASGEAIYVDRVELLYEGVLVAGQGPLAFTSSASTITIENADESLLIFAKPTGQPPLALRNATPAGQDLLFAGSGSAVYYALNRNEMIRPSFSNGHITKQALRESGRGADYIVIYPDDPDFVAALQPLLAHRSSQGLRVTAVSINQIYAEFAYGQQDPAAIRRFLSYALANWQSPAPRFVLLAGDASYDIYNNILGKNQNLLPAQMVHLGSGYASSDTWFVLANDQSSTIPQLAIGRFPAQTAAQLAIMVAKTLAYEADGRSSWQQRALFVSDSEPPFDNMSDALATRLETDGFEVNALHMGQSDTAHYDLMGALAKGVGLINYAGEGYVSQWGDGQVFAGDDAEMLANNGHTPIFTTFTCNNGAFTEPEVDSLAEDLLWVEGGGIVAAIAPSRSLDLQALSPFGDLFYAALLDDQVVTIGEALLHAQMAAADDPALQDAMLVVNLLGDPALRLQRP